MNDTATRNANTKNSSNALQRWTRSEPQRTEQEAIKDPHVYQKQEKGHCPYGAQYAWSGANIPTGQLAGKPSSISVGSNDTWCSTRAVEVDSETRFIPSSGQVAVLALPSFRSTSSSYENDIYRGLELISSSRIFNFEMIQFVL